LSHSVGAALREALIIFGGASRVGVPSDQKLEASEARVLQGLAETL
jgi:hypothetical protein